MIRIKIYCEDKTSGGLQSIIERRSNAERLEGGKPRLVFGPPSKLGGHHEVLKRVENARLTLYEIPPRPDHVFFVIDAFRAWEPKELGVRPPAGNSADEVERFAATVREAMRSLARRQFSDEEWANAAPRLHPHVLVWERESLMLPVTDRLVPPLGDPEVDVYGCRKAADELKRRHLKLYKDNYAKGDQGRRYLDQVVASRELQSIVLASNPSLRAIVNELVALP